MNNQTQIKTSWRAALGVIALSWGAFGIMEAPAKASKPENLVIAQVGVRSRVTPPTPINLRPRTHIPLPTGESIPQYDYQGNPIYQNVRRGRRRFRRGFGRRNRFGRHGKFGRFGHGGRHHRRRNHFRGQRHRRRFNNFDRRTNHGRFNRGIIIKKKF